jgi:hypothetical protein
MLEMYGRASLTASFTTDPQGRSRENGNLRHRQVQSFENGDSHFRGNDAVKKICNAAATDGV